MSWEPWHHHRDLASAPALMTRFLHAIPHLPPLGSRGRVHGIAGSPQLLVTPAGPEEPQGHAGFRAHLTGTDRPDV